MNRSKDLDNIAPDDEVVVTPPVEKTPSPKTVNETKTPATGDDLFPEIYTLLGHTKSPFSSFLVHPKVLKFAEEDDQEEIYLALRPHWITNLPWILITVAMIFVPFFFKYLSFLSFFPGRYQFALILFWYLLTFMYSFQQFLSWYFDLFLITNERVIDIEFNNLLNKHFAEADLSMIQDVSSSVRGVLGIFFNFGDVLIQTASEIDQITFEDVPNPEKIIKLLKELRDLQGQSGENKHA